MQRFCITEPLQHAGQQVAVPPGIGRQLTTVLRARTGDRLTLFNPGGPEWGVELISVDRSGAQARLIEPVTPPAPPARGLTLCHALLKGDRVEWVLQKCSELGVAAFQPLHSERVIASRRDVPERWTRIVIEAAELCGRVTIPPILPPASLESALSTSDPKVFCWEDERALALTDAVRTLPFGPIRLYIGPEGGFASHEVERARTSGAKIVSLGSFVMRADTAAIAATALVLLAT